MTDEEDEIAANAAKPAATETPAAAAAEAVAAAGSQTEANAEQKVAEPKKPSQGDRRFAHLSARAAADRARAEDAERRAAAAEALLAADKNGGKDGETTARPSQDAVRAEAERIVAQREFDQKRSAVIDAGVKAFGKEDWDTKAQVLFDMGAATASSPFMAALVEIDDAPQLVAYLADYVDELDSLLKLPPVAMAAKMGRLAAKLAKADTQTAKVEVEPKVTAAKISAAPKPVTPVTGRSSPAADVYDPKMTMAEYVALRAKTAPAKLGGQAKRA